MFWAPMCAAMTLWLTIRFIFLWLLVGFFEVWLLIFPLPQPSQRKTKGSHMKFIAYTPASSKEHAFASWMMAHKWVILNVSFDNFPSLSLSWFVRDFVEMIFMKYAWIKRTFEQTSTSMNEHLFFTIGKRGRLRDFDNSNTHAHTYYTHERAHVQRRKTIIEFSTKDEINIAPHWIERPIPISDHIDEAGWIEILLKICFPSRFEEQSENSIEWYLYVSREPF